MNATTKNVSRGLAAAALASALTFPAQASDADAIARGQTLYAAHCADCHGAGGEGTKDGPAVVGKGALPMNPPSGARMRESEFRTALDVAQFVVKNMPGDDAGSLEAEEYWAILAFALHANGVASSAPVDAESAAKIVLHE